MTQLDLPSINITTKGQIWHKVDDKSRTGPIIRAVAAWRWNFSQSTSIPGCKTHRLSSVSFCFLSAEEHNYRNKWAQLIHKHSTHFFLCVQLHTHIRKQFHTSRTIICICSAAFQTLNTNNPEAKTEKRKRKNIYRVGRVWGKTWGLTSQLTNIFNSPVKSLSPKPAYKNTQIQPSQKEKHSAPISVSLTGKISEGMQNVTRSCVLFLLPPFDTTLSVWFNALDRIIIIKKNFISA